MAAFSAEQEKALGSIIDRLTEEKIGSVKRDFDSFKRKLVTDIESELKTALQDITKAMPQELVGVVGKGLAATLSAVLSGKKPDARTIANSAASSLIPSLNDLMNLSDSQSSENLFGLLSSAKRNM